MAKNRYVNTAFWVDSYIARLGTSEKLAFLYLLTSPLSNIAGVYEVPLKRACFDTGLSAKEFAAALERFEADGKIVRHGEWMGLVNFVRHQAANPKVRLGIAKELSKAPRELAERLPATVAAARIGFDRLSHLNSTQQENPKRGLFTGLSPVSAHVLRQRLGRLREDREGTGDGEGW